MKKDKKLKYVDFFYLLCIICQNNFMEDKKDMSQNKFEYYTKTK